MCDVASLFGGPSSQETSNQAQTQGLANTYAADFNQNYGQQQGILKGLQAAYNPIVQAGPNQQGFGGAELAALNTSAGEGVGNNYAKASQALNNSLAARGGGSEALPTGASAALKGQLASSAAATQSQANLAITQANYQQGRNNWQNALSGLSNVSQQEAPGQYGQLASSEEATAFSQGKQLAAQKSAELGNIIGDVGSIASSFLPGGAASKAISGVKGLFGGGGNGGQQIAGPAGPNGGNGEQDNF